MILNIKVWICDKSQKKGVAYVISKDSVIPAPPVRRPPICPQPSAMIEPESPEAEKTLSMLVIGENGPLL